MSIMNKAKADWAKNTPCKNITIYGYCKYENDGCIFNHGKASNITFFNGRASSNSVANNNSEFGCTELPPTKSTFNVKAATSFSPSIPIPDFNIIKSFTPERIISPPVTEVNNFSFTPNYNPYGSDSFNPSGNVSGPGSATFPIATGGNNTVQQPASSPTSPSSRPNPIATSGYISRIADGTFPTVYPPSHSILQYHLYAPDPPPHLKVPLKPNERTPEMLFIPNDMREQFLKRNLSALQIFPSGGNLPEIVGDYFALVPLEFHNRQPNKERYLGHQNSLYKVFSNVDGKVFIIRRIHEVKITDGAQIYGPLRKWQKVSCSTIVKIIDAFTTRAFGDSSLCVVYEYYAQSNTLYESHFSNYNIISLTQAFLWNYLVQLTSAMREIHSHDLYINKLSLKKVIVTGDPGRIKLSDCGLYDILAFEENHNIHNEQQNDYKTLGLLMADLSRKMTSTKDQSIDIMDIDPLFKKVLSYLLSEKEKSIPEFTALFSHKILDVISPFQTYSEYVEQNLMRELENGRLFRLMCKLNFIFARLEPAGDNDWSEAGDKYPIILFYDYVFHQLDENGKSVMDLAHVLRCLNRLDCGVSEKIILVTPDEMNCIIVSYKELKDSIDSTFRSMTQ